MTIQKTKIDLAISEYFTQKERRKPGKARIFATLRTVLLLSSMLAVQAAGVKVDFFLRHAANLCIWTEKTSVPFGTEVFDQWEEGNQITPFSLRAATCSLVMPRLVRIASLSSPSSGAHFWHSSGSPWILMGVPGMRISRFMPG